MRTEIVGSVSEFLRGGTAIHESHFDKYGRIYKVAGVSLILLASGGTAFATGGIEAGARTLYYELANIGKWIIIFKGGIDVVKAIGDGDASTIKKAVITSLLSYLLLLGLPYGMDRVGELFDKVKHA
jgi:hypothetical protein